MPPPVEPESMSIPAQGLTPPVKGLPSAMGSPKLAKGSVSRMPPSANRLVSTLESESPKPVAKELIKLSGVIPSISSKGAKGDCLSKSIVSSLLVVVFSPPSTEDSSSPGLGTPPPVDAK